MTTTSGPDIRFRSRWAFVFCLGAAVASMGPASFRASGAADGAAPGLDVESPWISSHSIWFFSDLTELDRSERVKIVALALWVDGHAGSEVGISRPTGAADPESVPGRIHELRVAAIRAAMIEAGIPASRIHLGAYGNASSALDRRVVIFVRAEPDHVAGTVSRVE